MSAHVLFNLLNELRKMRGLSSILSLFATSLINSIIQEFFLLNPHFASQPKKSEEYSIL